MEQKVKQRIALSTFFFLSGLCFSSWAARIPDFKVAFDLNEAQLGSVLFVMPISSLIGLPISGWLVEKYDSRWPLFVATLCFSFFFLMIALAPSMVPFTVAIFLFAFSMRILNIAMNTQAITLQKNYGKKINGSFHGLWSMGGIAGVGFTTLMISYDINIITHFLIISVFTLLSVLTAFSHLIKHDKSNSGSRMIFKKPDAHIINLGLIILFAAICEGGMFDWSGIYFKEVVKVEIFTTGYLVFMTSMTISRFVSDWFIHKLGMPRLFIISSSLMALGLGVAVIFPIYWIAMIGFALVGLGTASVIPMTFSLAGTSKNFSVGIAISLLATFGMVGILLGPPLIGYVAHISSLRYSFVFVACTSLLIIPISRVFFKKNEVEDI